MMTITTIMIMTTITTMVTIITTIITGTAIRMHPRVSGARLRLA